MDVYRIGTLLELAREIASALAQDGAHVKVCVQQSMGQGVFQVQYFGPRGPIRAAEPHWYYACANFHM